MSSLTTKMDDLLGFISRKTIKHQGKDCLDVSLCSDIDTFCIDWSQIHSGTKVQAIRDLPEWYIFKTSGHTGNPKTWLRTKAQMIEEVNLVCSLIKGFKNIQYVYSYAPLNHMYGFLFSFLMPLLKSKGVTLLDVNSLPSSTVNNSLIVTIPSSLVLLNNFFTTNSFVSGSKVNILYSTATLPKLEIDKLQRNNIETNFFEILGSTETGMIAYKNDINSRTWTIAPDVTLKNNEIELQNLIVKGSRICYDSYFRKINQIDTKDLISLKDKTSFVLHGRESRVIKRNGLKLQLDDIENKLKSHINAELLCHAYKSNIRGEDFELLIVDNDVLKNYSIPQLLINTLEPSELPRRVSIVESLPRTNLGKIKSREVSSLCKKRVM